MNKETQIEGEGRGVEGKEERGEKGFREREMDKERREKKSHGKGKRNRE